MRSDWTAAVVANAVVLDVAAWATQTASAAAITKEFMMSITMLLASGRCTVPDTTAISMTADEHHALPVVAKARIEIKMQLT